MTRVALSMWLLCVALFALATSPAHADAFQISAASSKFSLGAGALNLELLVTPPQPALEVLTIETIVDTEGKTVMSELQAKGDGAKFVAAVDALHAGLYKMKVSGEDAASKKAVYEVVPFRVTVPVAIALLKLNGKEMPSVHKLDKPLLSSAGNDGLQIDVQLQNTVDKAPVLSHQAFLRFTHDQDKTETYFVLTSDASTKVQAVTLNFAALSKKFSYKSGIHSLQLILGDAKFDQAVVRDLGKVELLLGAAPPQAPSPLYAKHLLYESDTTLKALPEIKHVMRVGDSRPPMAVSLAFTGAVLVPLVAFVLFVLKMQLNISKLFSGSVFVFGVGFVASFAAILLLFVFYWIELTMFQTLGYLAVVGVANVTFGHFTLKRLAQSSASVAKPKKE